MLTISAFGNLGRDPEQKTLPNGNTVTNFSIAANTGKDQTTWISCTVFGVRGDTVMQFFKKGSKVAVSGSGKLREYTDRDGVIKQSLDLVVSDFSLPVKAAAAADESLDF
jgi:single-strand DNA-binding protein